MKHDAESEALQNDAIVRLAHAVAGVCAHAGFNSGVVEAHAVVKALTEAPAELPAAAVTNPEPVAIVHDVTEADES